MEFSALSPWVVAGVGGGLVGAVIGYVFVSLMATGRRYDRHLNMLEGYEQIRGMGEVPTFHCAPPKRTPAKV